MNKRNARRRQPKAPGNTSRPDSWKVVPTQSVDVQALQRRAQSLLNEHKPQAAYDLLLKHVDAGLEQAGVFHSLCEISDFMKKPEVALGWAERAAQGAPERESYKIYLGKLLIRVGRVEEAAKLLQPLVDAGSGKEAQWPLAHALMRLGRGKEAVALVKDRIPGDFQEAYQLAQTCKLVSEFWLGIPILEKLREADATMPILNELGIHYQRAGRLRESADALRQCIEECRRVNEPRIYHGLSNLGNSLVLMGQVDEAIDIFREGMECVPDHPVMASNYLFNKHYLPTVDRVALYEDHRQLGLKHAPPSRMRQDHENTPDPDRKLRIGYVSPDMRSHSVAHFLEPVLAGRDPEQFEVYCYASIARKDAYSRRIEAEADVFRLVQHMTDEELAQQYIDDKIDILVDLSGHTGDSRIWSMVTKPAPVQVTYLGYPDTTGLPCIDYRLTDPLADPPENEELHTEELAYLPDCFLCYRPPIESPLVDPRPAADGHIVFGSFNNQAKVNKLMVGLWAEVLRAVPDSELLLKFRGSVEDLDQAWRGDFEACGIDPVRIRLVGMVSSMQHLDMYNEMDIALDTYPYNGTTTTCEALWMGVPVISLVGEHHMSRVGLSILKSLDLEFFAAATPQEYITKAVALSRNVEARTRIRETMRIRMAKSKLCDPARFCSDLEQLYRAMWHRWCEKEQSLSAVDRLQKGKSVNLAELMK